MLDQLQALLSKININKIIWLNVIKDVIDNYFTLHKCYLCGKHECSSRLFCTMQRLNKISKSYMIMSSVLKRNSYIYRPFSIVFMNHLVKTFEAWVSCRSKLCYTIVCECTSMHFTKCLNFAP